MRGVPGQVALERGPIVFAFEGVDNDGTMFGSVIPPDAKVTPEYLEGLLGGVTVLKVNGARRAFRKAAGDVALLPTDLVAIPYAVWANRGQSPMTVWVAREPGRARLGPKPTLATRAKVSTSFHREGMEPARVNDGLAPQLVGEPALGQRQTGHVGPFVVRDFAACDVGLDWGGHLNQPPLARFFVGYEMVNRFRGPDPGCHGLHHVI